MVVTENELTKVARIAAHAAQGVTIKDADGKQQNILPSGDKNMIDLSGVSFGGNTGGNTGGGDNPDHPSAGADYYAGSLADGEITERELLWQGESDPTKTTNVTLLKDVGAKFNMAGEGISILVHLDKTIMTAGVKGATSEVKLNYDVNNAAKEGYFTTTSPYPIYISASDLVTKQELVVPINGIGENLSGVNVKAPELHITFKDDKTIDISQVSGYDNDGADSGATGANYDLVTDIISTFSTQKAVAQLPASINLFSGSSYGNIALAGATDYFENVMDGIEIILDDYFYYKNGTYWGRAKRSSFGISKTITIRKNNLIQNNKIMISNNYSGQIVPYNSSGDNGGSWDNDDDYTFEKFESFILIANGSIKINAEIHHSITPTLVRSFDLNVLQIKPIKD